MSEVEAITSIEVALHSVQKETAQIFWRVDADMKEMWVALCKAKKIDQNAAGQALLTWFMQQDQLVQSMLIGQVAADPDLISILLKKLSRPADGQGYRRAAKPREDK